MKQNNDLLRAQGKKILEMCDNVSLDQFTLKSQGSYSKRDSLIRDNMKLEKTIEYETRMSSNEQTMYTPC